MPLGKQTSTAQHHVSFVLTNWKDEMMKNDKNIA